MTVGEAKGPALHVGDHVRVRPGVRDLDFKGCEIGGWTGRITAVSQDLGAKSPITVTWDRRTRLAIPAAIRKRCLDEGLGFAEMDLQQGDVERIEAPAVSAPGSLDDLLNRMEDEEDSPAPDILEAILATGDEAIEPLREIVHRGCGDLDVAGTADVAAGLLGALKAHAAVPDRGRPPAGAAEALRTGR